MKTQSVDSGPASPPGDTDQFLLALLHIFEKPAGSGNFSEQNPSSDANQPHRYSWATGTGWLASKAGYERRFGPVPVWLLGRHPFYRRQACELALRVGQQLPGTFQP